MKLWAMEEKRLQDRIKELEDSAKEEAMSHSDAIKELQQKAASLCIRYYYWTY